MKKNLILMTDSYKLSHYQQYPEGTTKVFSYIESRGGRFAETVFFGLQYYIKEYLTKPISREDIEQADTFAKAHGVPFNKEGWEHILEKHNGFLPLKIYAVPEGTVVPTHNVLVTVENTDPKCFWLTSYVETLLLKIWYPITVATLSYNSKKIIKNFLSETADDLSGLPFKLHDFGYRGVSSEESAALGGAAHLVNFMGTDTIVGAEMLMNYYKSKAMPGFSIFATEHSTITSWEKSGEFAAYENFVNVTGQHKLPIAACVSDSYNIYEAIKMWGKLKDKLEANGTMLVVRPDSGDPVKMSLECAQLLDKEFGSVKNKKGYKLLNNVRIIYGDGISNEDVIFEILKNLKDHGFSADNIAFGMGGGMLQKVDRDTQKFAMKCSAVVVNGKMREVFKDPITDAGKKSKKGFLDLQVDVKGNFKTIEYSGTFGVTGVGSALKPVFENGKMLVEYSLDEIRERANS